MAILSTFIGVNKFADPGIRDLSGATKDAQALWALFKDTLPDLEAELLIDEGATVESIREALDRTLGKAEEDDTVIIFFAGHGSNDHRLVVHDTTVSDLANTAIPMQEMSDRFKASGAKSILCILDCCFSGEAPARVLADSPVPRSPENPFTGISGKGKVLLAASNYDEMSYEFPGGGHGLLTNALLEVFQKGEDTIDVQTALGEVMKIVRTSAGRLGVQQTPVALGQFTGGLNFPVLKPGTNFWNIFPESKGARVTSAIADLKAFNVPEIVTDEWQQRFPGGLNELQLEAVNEYRILDGASLFVIAPTSSGKTFVGEMAAVRASLQGQKTVFLLPYKALTNEKYEQFSQLYGDRLGLRVIRCTGDRLDNVNQFVRGKYDLALLTYEMFLALVVGNPAILNQIGLVVLDEGQFITDPNRGISVELLLTYLITARDKGINPQLIILSAVVGATNGFESWLQCSILVSATRPVPLIEGVLDRSGVFQFRDIDGTEKTEQLLPSFSIVQRRKAPSSQDVIVPLVTQLLRQSDTEQIIIFRNMRGSAAGCATYLARELGLPPAEDALAELPIHDLSATSARLRECLSGGTAFHTTNLTPEEKEVVERAFRNPDGRVRVLGATTTVAAGINTPASTVVLAEQEFVGEDGRDFTIAEYKNMAGRAGRLGFSETGRSIILADNLFQRSHLFRKYVLGDLEPIHSSFAGDQIQTWVIRLLAQVGSIGRTESIKLLANTYGGYLAARADPEWPAKIQAELERLIEQFKTLGLIEQNVDTISLTPLGHVCGRSSLLFSSAIQLITVLRRIAVETLTAPSLIALVQGLPEMDRVYTPMAKAGRTGNRRIIQSETQWPTLAMGSFGRDIVTALQSNVADSSSWYSRCKRALILTDWIRGISVEQIEQRFSGNAFSGIEYGHIQSIASTTRFHLRAAAEIAAVMFGDRAPTDADVEAILKQLEVGMPTDALELLDLPTLLTRGEYLTLYGAGIKRESEVWDRSPDELETLLGKRSAARLESYRPGSDSGAD